jgi:hypothetical protein
MVALRDAGVLLLRAIGGWAVEAGNTRTVGDQNRG